MARTKQRWFLKEWRKSRSLTQEALAEAIGSSSGYISELEKGKRRYNQDLLETLAEALQCTPADLLNRDPSDSEAIWSIWDQLDNSGREHVVDLAKTVLKRTGTGG